MILALFDMDGTLVDSQAHIMAAMADAFAACDLPLPPRAEVLSGIGISLEPLMARLAGPDHAARLAEAYRAGFAQRRGKEDSPLFAGAAEMLRALQADPDVVLGLATGKSRRGVDAVLAAQGLTGMFDTIQTADTHPSKPHPSMVLRALDETLALPEQAVMIGDTSFDMDMAQAAGVRRVYVPWGYHRADQVQADATITRFEDLPALLRQLTGEAS